MTPTNLARFFYKKYELKFLIKSSFFITIRKGK